VQLENTRLEQQGTTFFINRKQTFFGTKKSKVTSSDEATDWKIEKLVLTFLAGAETDMACHLLEPK
jgi:hypothetical protein